MADDTEDWTPASVTDAAAPVTQPTTDWTPATIQDVANVPPPVTPPFKSFKDESEYRTWLDENRTSEPLPGKPAVFDTGDTDHPRSTVIAPDGNGVSYDLRGLWKKYATKNPVTGQKELDPSSEQMDEFARPDAPQGFTADSRYAKGKDPNSLGFWDVEDGKEVWRDADYVPQTTTQKVMQGAKKMAGDAVDGIVHGATHPLDAIDNAEATGYAAAQGLGGEFHKLGETANVIGGAVPVLYDQAKSLLTGKETTAAGDWWFKNTVDPLTNDDDAFEVAKDAGLPEKLAHSFGSALGFISEAVLTGGEGTALSASATGLDVAKAAVEHGVKAAAVPALTDAVDTGRKVYEATGDGNAAMKAAQMQWIVTNAGAIVPMSASGGLVKRAAAGAVSGTVAGETGRTAMNTQLPASMQTPFSGENLGVEAIGGAVMGGVGGHAPGEATEYKPDTTPTPGEMGDAADRAWGPKPNPVDPNQPAAGGLPGPAEKPWTHEDAYNAFHEARNAVNRGDMHIADPIAERAQSQADLAEAAAKDAPNDPDLAQKAKDMRQVADTINELVNRPKQKAAEDTPNAPNKRAATDAKVNMITLAARDDGEIETKPNTEGGTSVVVAGKPVADFQTEKAAETAAETAKQAVVERRVDTEQRKKVSAMTPDELRQTILTHELTGIPNRRAYEESEKLPVQASIDADSLKWVNDNGGHAAGDQVLKTIAQALNEASPGKAYGAFHISGDEFVLQGQDHDTVDRAIAQARERLAGAKVEFTGPNGDKVTLNGIGFSHGKGATLEEADGNLQAEKDQREREGSRAARGEQPPGTSRTPAAQGLPADENQPAAEKPVIPAHPQEPVEAPSSSLKDEHHQAALDYLRWLRGERGAKTPMDVGPGIHGGHSFQTGKPLVRTGHLKVDNITELPIRQLWKESGEPPPAPIEQPPLQEQTEDHGNGALPSAGLPEGSEAGHSEAAPAGSGSGEPLDEGVADRGESSPQERPVPGIAEGSGEPGAENPPESGEQPSGAPRDHGAVRPESETAHAGAGDHALSDEELAAKGHKAKYDANLAAIKILKAMEAEKRLATPEERSTLAKYVGWGALKGVFDPANKQWAKQHEELKALLTDEEWKAARASTLNAHYTSKPVVHAIYQALNRLGFNRGRILEPSVGTGNFFGLMPPDMRGHSELHGVELDPLTAKIAKALYPSANIKQGGFQDFEIPSEYFDATVGNPPFGSEPIVDTARSPYSGVSIHNYFLSKAIDKLRPGGLMAVVVSHNFLDAANDKTRQWIAKRANLVGAVRLPNTAFKDNAGTEVVTDVLVFQKRPPKEYPDDTQWVKTVEQKNRNPKTDETFTHSVNQYMVEHPANVLGTPSAAGTMYRPGEYTVEPSGDLGEQLESWVKTLPENAYTPVERGAEQLDIPDVAIPDGVKAGSFFVDDSGAVRRRLQDALGKQRSEGWEHPNLKALERMKRMIGLRDLLRSQMRLERSPDATNKDIEANRKKLNAAYDQFKTKYGLLNSPVNRRIFLDDTESPLLLALEFNYDRGVSDAVAEKEGIEARAPSATKADILKRRVLFPPADDIKVSTAKDALLASLNYKGQVDPDYMATVYNKTPEAIERELGDLVYRDPQAGLVTADEYLSGDVKTKLAEAKAAGLERNVKALEKIIPEDKLPSQIHASLGTAFIPPEVYGKFYEHITGAPHEVTYVPATAGWLTHKAGAYDNALNSDKWGTTEINAANILDKTMAGQVVVITKTYRNADGTTTTVVLPNETALAQAKQAAIKDEWKQWLWKDPDQAERVAGLYNDTMNRIVNRKFDGGHMTFPGMSPAMKLLDHQKNAVWRGLQTRQMLLDHVVGAGKTFAVATLAMEMRRLGISRKPLLAVPNHLTGQWRSEFSRLYPSSYILVAEPEDFKKENREKFFSKIVTGDWDTVIVGHSSLKKIPLPPETEERVITAQIQKLTEAIEEIKRARGDRNIIRDMEGIKKRLEAKFQKKVNALGDRDKAVSFDELGIDSIMVDELHEFKNLFYSTAMAKAGGMGNPNGSDKAFDLFVKMRWLNEAYGDKAPIVGATGTPVSNSLVEMYNMQRYLQYPTMERMGLDVFDAWAKQFGDMESVYEVAPSGTGWRSATRFQKFANMPALMSLYRTFADVITLDNLKAQEAAQGKVFPVPRLRTGGPINVVADRSPEQAKFMGEPRLQLAADGLPTFDLLAREGLEQSVAKLRTPQDEKTGKYALEVSQAQDPERFQTLGKEFETREDAEMEAVSKGLTPKIAVPPESILGQFENLRELTKATKGKINALSLTGAANKAGLDYRLIDPNATDFPGSKINKAVGNIVKEWKHWKADKGTQLVFCDLSVPLSARDSAAKKPRLAYVRDPTTNELTDKRATLHTVEGHESIPYLAVETGKKGEKKVDMYDAASGRFIKGGFANKPEAHAWAEKTLSDEGTRTQWHMARNEAGEIDQDSIDDYNNTHEIDPEEINTIAREDIAGASGSSKFSVYDDIKAKLIKAGIPAREIAFIHDYHTPQAKMKLFAQVNNGEVRVLLGSTPKMGAGTNVQQRIVAWHHIDAPWRPSDLEQRNGRGMRRGNLLYERDPENFEVAEYRYATAQTYDTRRWQIQEHKARGIEQLRNYDTKLEELEDIEGQAANAAEMKAAASGDPLILEETRTRNEVQALEREQVAVADQQVALRNRAKQARADADTRVPKWIAQYSGELKLVEANPKDKDGWAPVSVNGKAAKGKDSWEALAGKAVAELQADKAPTVKLVYRGLEFEMNPEGTGKRARIALEGPSGYVSAWDKSDAISIAGLLTRLDNYAEKLPAQIEQLKFQRQDLYARAAEAEEAAKHGFEKQAELDEARAAYRKVRDALLAKGPPVPEQDLAILEQGMKAQKEGLKALGLGDRLDELRRGQEMMARGEKGGKLSVDVVKAHAAALINEFAVKPKGLVVVKTAKDLLTRSDVGPRMKAAVQAGDKVGVTAAYLPSTGKLYVVADQIHSLEHLAGIIAHEQVVHFGMRAAFGSPYGARYQEILDGVAQALPGATRLHGEREIGAGFNMAIPSHKSLAAEEALAYYAQKQAQGGTVPKGWKVWVDKLRQLIRDWIRKVLGMAPKFDDLYIRNVLSALREHLRTGKETPPVEGAEPVYAKSQKTFFSAVARAVDAAKREKGTGAEWEATIRNMPGVKDEELQWLGLKEWLAGKGRVTKAEIADYVHQHRLEMQESLLGMGVSGGPQHIEALHSWVIENTDYHSRMDVEEDERLVSNALRGDAAAIGELEMRGVPEALLEPLYNPEKANGDVTQGPPKYDQYKTPGGNNYRELLMILPERSQAFALDDFITRMADKYNAWEPMPGGRTLNWDKVNLTDEEHEEYGRLYNEHAQDPGPYQSGHWNHANVMAHTRFDERELTSGERTLHVHEVQSDWHQAGRRYGYKQSNVAPNFDEMIGTIGRQRKLARSRALEAIRNKEPALKDMPETALDPMLYPDVWGPSLQTRFPEAHEHVQAYFDAIRRQGETMDEMNKYANRVPNAPFKTSWPELVMKRLLRHAVEKGMDALSWDTGQTNADRYNMQNHVDRIVVQKDGHHYSVFGYKDGRTVVERRGTEEAKLPELLGKDMASKAIEGGAATEFKGDDLKLGGHGMHAFYDKMLPTTMGKIVKKMGGKVESGEVQGGDEVYHDMGGQPIPAHVIRITPQMRDAVLEGQPLFARSIDDPIPKDDELLFGRAGLGGKVYSLARRAVTSLVDNQLVMDVRKLVNPRSVNDVSKMTATRVIPYLADLARQHEQTIQRLEQFSRTVDRLTAKEQEQSYYEAEMGLPQSIPAMQPVMDTLQRMLRDEAQQTQALGPGHLDNFIENYLPHYYLDEAKARKFFQGPFGRRPMRGPATFKKQRYYATMREAIEQGGLKPLTFNPLIQSLMKIYEMQRYRMGVMLLQHALKGEGLAVYFPMAKKIPDGWKEIDDPSARVSSYSEQEGGFVQRGRYAMPEDAARLINNHLGINHLGNFSPAQALRAFGNTMTAMQLGFSGFHVGFTSTDALVSKVGLAYERLANGEPLQAAKAFLEAAVGPFGVGANLRRGILLNRAYLNPIGRTPELQALAQHFVGGGGRARMDTSYLAAQGINPFKGVGIRTLAQDIRQALSQPEDKVAAVTKALGSFPLEYAQRNWRALKEMGRAFPLWELPFEAVGRITRASTGWIMEHIVPWQKMGVFSDMAADFLRRHPDATPIEVNEEMQAITHSVDNRLGEVVYDNNFWNRSFKMALHLSLRAVGWRFGTVQEIVGGGLDFVKAADTLIREGRLTPKAFTHKMGYLMGLITLQAISGALIQYLLTGEAPRDTKDMMFPRTGRFKKDGTPERLSLPTYAKDMYGYLNEPGKEVGSMLAPILGELYYQMTNSDYFGDPIYDPDDTPLEELGERMHHMIGTYTPFVVQNTNQMEMTKDPGMAGTLARVASFFGAKPAPKAITNPEQLKEREHYEDMKRWEKKLRYDLHKANTDGDKATAAKLRARLAELKQTDAQEHAKYLYSKAHQPKTATGTASSTPDPRTQAREAAKERRAGHTSQLIEQVGPLIDASSSRAEMAQKIHAAGYPALAGLIGSLPDRLRPQVMNRLQEYA